MRILVAGCWRSGTTGLYNLVRLICQEHGQAFACFDDTYNESIGGEFDFEVVKVHKYRREWLEWADVVITIWREPKDVYLSMCRFWNEEQNEIMEKYGRGLTWFGLYNRHANYESHFNQLSRSTEKLARHLAEVIGVEIDEKDIVRQFRQVRPPKRGYDPVTLLHSNHVTK
jgi:hypothetical protein